MKKERKGSDCLRHSEFRKDQTHSQSQQSSGNDKELWFLKKHTEFRCGFYRRGLRGHRSAWCGVRVEAAVVGACGAGREEEQMLPAWLRLTLWPVSPALSEMLAASIIQIITQEYTKLTLKINHLLIPCDT